MASEPGETLVHATVVDIAGHGVLLRGPSGSGKSDVALRLLDRGATLVCDDQAVLQVRKKGVKATAPAALRGFLEIRGLGLVSMPVTGSTYISLIVELVAADTVPRLPEYKEGTLLDKKIPLIQLNAFEVSTALKIELAAKDRSRIGNTGPERHT